MHHVAFLSGHSLIPQPSVAWVQFLVSCSVLHTGFPYLKGGGGIHRLVWAVGAGVVKAPPAKK